MVTLNNPITSQNIVDRFEELVTDIADHHIVWGTDNLPGHSSFSASGVFLEYSNFYEIL